MKPWVAPFIIMWAVVATAAAVFFAFGAAEPETARPEGEEAANATPSDRESYAGRTTRRLRQRVEQLTAALATALPTIVETVPELSGDDETAPAMTPGERVLSLVDELRRLEDSDDWHVDKDLALRRQINALLATDTSTHLALMERLKVAPDEEAAHDVLSELTENPFAKFVSHGDVDVAIRSAAVEMLDDPRPHLRAAAARVLYAYGSPYDYTREHVLTGLARLDVETDPDVWDNVLAELSVAAHGHGLTEEEARPLIDGLRQRAAERGGGWAAGSLAQWTTDEADLAYIERLLSEAKSERRGQSILNALDRDTRLAGAFPDRTRNLLLSVLEGPAQHEHMHGMALHFLRNHAPWDEMTASTIRRYTGD